MITFHNRQFDVNELKNVNLFVTCLGYEERSFNIYEKVKDYIDKSCLMVFTIDDYKTFSPEIVRKIDAVEDLIVGEYAGEYKVQSKIINRVKEISEEKDVLRIAIDYSSMPRGWYCKLPELIMPLINHDSDLSFWYSEGEYSVSPEFYSTVGIESYHVFSGKPSFSTNRSRTHFIGVGYDAIRTQGLLSILDPEEYVICEAYNPHRREIHDSICKVNEGIIEQTSNVVSLYINDIEFMVSKLKGLINEYYFAGESDVILVPDGPKPLIFIMSIMPWLIDRSGVSCLHVTRNSNEVKKNNVKAQGGIIGFSITNEV